MVHGGSRFHTRFCFVCVRSRDEIKDRSPLEMDFCLCYDLRRI
jgi:hypothetical protein